MLRGCPLFTGRTGIRLTKPFTEYGEHQLYRYAKSKGRQLSNGISEYRSAPSTLNIPRNLSWHSIPTADHKLLWQSIFTAGRTLQRNSIYYLQTIVKIHRKRWVTFLPSPPPLLQPILCCDPPSTPFNTETSLPAQCAPLPLYTAHFHNPPFAIFATNCSASVNRNVPRTISLPSVYTAEYYLYSADQC